MLVAVTRAGCRVTGYPGRGVALLLGKAILDRKERRRPTGCAESPGTVWGRGGWWRRPERCFGRRLQGSV